VGLHGKVFGLIFGSLACIQHYVLRIILWRNGFAPLNYVRFLNCAVGRIFLRKVGGGYIFVHRLLLRWIRLLLLCKQPAPRHHGPDHEEL